MVDIGRFRVEEGDDCPWCREGTAEYTRQRPCSCHNHPPCSACVDAPLMCDSCGVDFTELAEEIEQYDDEHSFGKQETKMNYSALAALLNENVKAVGVQFSGYAPETIYAYKTTLDLNIGDIVVVPSLSKQTDEIKYSVAEVVTFDVEIDHESRLTYRWVVDRVNFDMYDDTINKEEDMIETVKVAEREKKKKTIAETLMEHLPADITQIAFGKVDDQA